MQRTPRTAVQRRLDVALIALAVFTAVAVITALVLDSRPAQSAAASSYTPAVAGPSEDARPTALFIGDSYTNGTGASKAERWTTLVSKEMGWREVNRGKGGTGFVSTADEEGCGQSFCPAYPGSIEEAADVDAEIVVIAGGQDDFRDYADDPGPVEQAIQETYNDVKETFPEARIIAVGPSTAGDVDDTVLGMATDVREAADSAGAQYVSLVTPDVIEDDMVLEDGGHVGPDGHAAIADRVLSVIR